LVWNPAAIPPTRYDEPPPLMENYFPALATFFAVFLGAGIFVLLLVGRHIGRRRAELDPEGSHTGIAAVDGAVFGMLGLLIAFTFSGAAGRFDERRILIVTEVNDIGTAWLRIDLLDAADQPALRELFRRYVDARLATYGDVRSAARVTAANAEALRQQAAIWKHAVGASRSGAAPEAARLLLPALTAMFDTAEMRRRVTTYHPPFVVFAMLATYAMVGAMLAGYGMSKSRALSRIHAFGFAIVLASTVYVIVDIEYPRRGFIRVDAADQAMIDLRRGMN
jgi:hypothetical protein